MTDFLVRFVIALLVLLNIIIIRTVDTIVYIYVYIPIKSNRSMYTKKILKIHPPNILSQEVHSLSLLGTTISFATITTGSSIC